MQCENQNKVCVFSPRGSSQLLFWFQVCVIVSMLHAHFSPAIYESVVALISHLDLLQSTSEAAVLNHSSSLGSMSNQVEASVFGISVSVNLESVSLHIDLANNGENSSLLTFSVQKLDIRLVITTEFMLGIHIYVYVLLY